MKKLLLILTALFVSLLGYSQTFTDTNFIEYTVIPATSNVAVTGYDFPNGGVTVDIPATVGFNSTTYTVTEIGDEAFLAYGSTEKITSVVIPNGVTFIGYRAFQGNLLTSVTIPDSVTQLSNLSFGENPLLASVVLSNNLTDIAQYSFVSCALTNISIPNGVTSIGNLAFANNQLTSVTIPSTVSSIGIQGFKGNPLTCVVSENTTPPTIVSPTGPNTSTDTFSARNNIHLTIPSGTLGAYATDAGALWTGFNSVSEGLTGTFVVDYITYQINANPNNEVTAISYNTAGGTVVDIPATVYRGCTNFSVTEIGASAFSNKGLTSVTLPSSLTTINIGGFLSNALTSIVIPVSVTFIGNLSFKSNQITSVIIPSGATAGYESFKDNVITNVTFEDGVTLIAPNAFENNQISNIIIPSSVTHIGPLTFAGNPLVHVTSLAMVPPTITTGTNDTFIFNRGNTTLHIPAGTMGAYVTNAGALWTGFNPVTEDALSVFDLELANDVKIITTANALQVVYSNNIRLQNYALYNVTGSKIASGSENEIPTNYLTNGVYFLKLDFDLGTVVKKVMIN